jgi:hypothetical protein
MGHDLAMLVPIHLGGKNRLQCVGTRHRNMHRLAALQHSAQEWHMNAPRWSSGPSSSAKCQLVSESARE